MGAYLQMVSKITCQEILRVTRSWIGTPYRHRASLKGVGCDCLGLLRGVYRELYGLDSDPTVLPPYRPDWYERTDRDALLLAAGEHLEEIPIPDMTIGDVVVFRMRPGSSAKHCAIISGPDSMIHAHERVSVVEVSMGQAWKNKIAGAFRFPELEG